VLSESEFYTSLFTQDPSWSSPHPNYDEALRGGKLLAFLSQIVHTNPGPLRILDVGCGRGWLTHLASQYGTCEGVDPVAPVVALARRRYPALTFYVGSLPTVVLAADFRPYDVVLCSEVIEHVRDSEKDAFIRDLRSVLVPSGHLLLTSPRREWFAAWSRMGYVGQPVEEWLSERQLLRLLSSHSFIRVSHDRVYLPLERMSLFHRVCESKRLAVLLYRLHLAWLLMGLRFAAGFYQVWWFRAAPNR